MTNNSSKADLLAILKQLPISILHKKIWSAKLDREGGIQEFECYLSDCNYKINLAKSSLITYPDNLPVSQNIELIKMQILANQVLIICGETGSGKTTQLPKLLFEMGFANYGTIGHTQPRRIAARSIAKRVSEELSNQELVGYKIRFHDKTSSKTAIKLMTDGVLLQEIQNDKYLLKYSALIIDEAHERSLNIDFILGYLKSILFKRPDLKLIITSATIDNQKIANFFNNVKVIEIPGKVYPVDIIYQDIDELTDLNNAIYQAISSYLEIGFGNILVFMPGEREIKDCVNFLRKTKLNIHEILPFFSRQTESEQSLIFNESGKLKIIVTTNIAETSLTIPGVQFVIDSGLAKVKRYSIRSRVEQLQVEKISKSSIIQRTGRAGRVSHGLCVRLFSEVDFNLRPQYTDPEILRSNLANVILKLLVFKLGRPNDFPFLDQPSEKSFNDGFKILYQLGAIDENNQITKLGLEIAKIPIDANLARMIVAANKSSLSEVLIITSFLSIVDPREVPIEYKTQALEKQEIWLDKKSDFLTILNLWAWYKDELIHSKSRKKSLEKFRSHFLSANRLREWSELHSQLKELVLSMSYLENSDAATYELIHKAILTGLLNNIGQKDVVENFYLGTNSKKFLIHPNSKIDKAKWICSGTLMQTAKLYARINAAIDPIWLVPLTKHLVKYTYDCEAWDRKRGEVTARQNSILYGLLIYQIKVPLALTNHILAREIFIREALVLENINITFAFLKHNNQVIQQLEDLEDKFRSHFIILEDELFKFYDGKLPLEIFDVKTLEAWLKIPENIHKLDITYDEFIKLFMVDNSSFSLYPDTLSLNNEVINLTYIFDKERLDDGVTAEILLNQLNNLDEEVFSWLVPGLIRDKVSYIVKSLPKAIRVQINPLNEFITNFLHLDRQEIGFSKLLADYIAKIINHKILVKQIEEIDLPAYLKFHFKIIDNNQILLVSDNLKDLKLKLASHMNQLISDLNNDEDLHDIREWSDDLNDLLQEVKLQHKNGKIKGYKSLVIKDNLINLTKVNSLDIAKTNTKIALRKLIRYKFANLIKYLEQKQYYQFRQSSLLLSNIYNREDLLSDSIDYLVRNSIDLSTIPKTSNEFQQLVNLSQIKLSDEVPNFGKTMFEIAKFYNQVQNKIIDHPLFQIIELQLDDLIFPGFLKYINSENLVHIPRYLKAILIRCDKYWDNKVRDMQLEEEVSQVYNVWYEFVDLHESQSKKLPQSVYSFKYKIEELRVSLFAQELKTPFSVSSKRLFKELSLFEEQY